MVTAARETRRHWGQVGLCADVKNEIHADHNVEKKVTVEEPIAGIISPESHHNIAIIGYGNCILKRWLRKIPLQHSHTIQLQGVFQIDLLNGFVRRSSQSDDVERRAMQMKGMTKIHLLHFIHQDNFHDRSQRYVHHVCALTVWSTIWRTIVSVAEILRRNVIDL